MLIEQDKTSQQALYDSVEIIKTGKKDKITREKLYIEFVKYCLAELNIPNAEFEVDPKMFGHGAYYKGKISFGKKAMKNRFLIEPLNTIAHELRHYKQDLTKQRFKVVDSNYKTTYPLDNFMSGSMHIFYEDFINNFAFYHTSKTEKDARDYAMSVCDKYLSEIKDFCKSNRKVSKFYEKSMKHIEKAKIREEFEYKSNLRDVEDGKDFIKLVTKGILKEVFEKVEERTDEKNKSVEHSLTCIINMYCDDYLMERIFDFCIKHKDAKALLSCMDCTNSNVTKEQFMKALDLFEETGILKEKKLEDELSNWDTTELKRLCKEHEKMDKKFTTRKKFQTFEKTEQPIFVSAKVDDNQTL